MMRIDQIHPTLREALCIFSSLRKLGFPSDDIFVMFNAGKNERDVLVRLSERFLSKKMPGTPISFRAGSIEGDHDPHYKTLVKFCNLPDELRESIVERIMPESNVANQGALLVTVLMDHGASPWIDKRKAKDAEAN